MPRPRDRQVRGSGHLVHRASHARDTGHRLTRAAYILLRDRLAGAHPRALTADLTQEDTPMPNPSITVKTSATFQNWHLTSSVGGPVGKLFIPFNAWTDNSAVPADQPFAPGLAGLKSIVQQAEAASMRVRALGSRWSLNNIAYVKDYLIDTANLTSLMVGFSANSIDPGFQGNKDFVVFAQCGATISKLNNDLANWSPPLALPTSGASNGQTIAGAMSTGTHG